MRDPLARVVRCLFKYERRRQHELAAHLVLVPSALSNALRRPGALERHRAGVASFWQITPERLAELAELDDEALESAAAAVVGVSRPRDVAVPGGWLVPLARAAIGAYGPGRWAFVIKRSPVRGELVAYPEATGYHLGVWSQDGDTQVVVGPRHQVRVLTPGKDTACHPVILMGERPEEDG